jgi:DNA-binding transcriptional LysR family regulator
VLYRRAGRSLALTPEGTEVAAFARDFDDRSRELVARLGGRADQGSLVLAAGAGALLYVIGEGLRAFRRQPGGPLELLTADAAAAVEAVRAGNAHVGVGALDADPEGLKTRTLTSVEQVVVMPQDHRLARRRRVSLTDLADERLVLPPEGRPHRMTIEAAARSAGVRVGVGAVARGWELAVKLVELGFGIAIVNGCCRAARGLVKRPVLGLPPVRYVAFTRARVRQDAAELVLALAAKGEAWRQRA